MDLQIKSSRVVLATDSAVNKLKELKLAENADGSFLRMGVKPGGCSGLSYEMFFDTEKYENDFTEQYGEVSIVVDGQSVDHIRGATLDYKDCLLYTSPSPRDKRQSRMPSSA